jgi:hypothetical protein
MPKARKTAAEKLKKAIERARKKDRGKHKQDKWGNIETPEKVLKLLGGARDMSDEERRQTAKIIEEMGN